MTETKELQVQETGDRPIAEYFSGMVREAIDGLPDEYTKSTEKQLEELAKPQSQDWGIRHRFWELIRAARASGADSIQHVKIFDNVCSRKYFYSYWSQNPAKVAWTLCPIDDHKEICVKTYEHALVKLKAYVMESRVSDENVMKILKVTEFLANRGIGAVVNRVQAAHLHGVMPGTAPAEIPATPEEADKRLTELRQKMFDTAKDVTPIDVEATKTE